MTKDPFVQIRPYNDAELPYAINRMLANEGFVSCLVNFMPDIPLPTLSRKIRKYKTIFEFQKEIFSSICQTFIERSIDELTISGFENIDPNKSYLYVANHRDIILDSALLQVYRLKNGLKPCLSGIGDNLLSSQILTDVAKVCNMFTIVRSGNARTMVASSRLVSEYIHYNITQNLNSIWIAQRNGRTKDGLDKTQQSVLKMFCSFNREKGIYEFEPCDQMKAREMVLTEGNKKYVKAPDEDFKSITTGIFSDKGRVHIQFGKTINDEIDTQLNFACDNERIQYVCSLIDKQIYLNYKLWQNNYIAYDILNNSTEFADKYTDEAKKIFVRHIRKQANTERISYAKMKQQLLNIYANPVKMAMATKS